MALGTPDIPLYYFDLTSIAIGMVNMMEIEKKIGRDWNKLPEK